MIKVIGLFCLIILQTDVSFSQNHVDKHKYIEIKQNEEGIKTIYKFDVDSIHLIVNTTSLNKDTLFTFHFVGSQLQGASMKFRKTDIGSHSFTMVKGYTMEKFIKMFPTDVDKRDIYLANMSQSYYKTAMIISPFKKTD